MDKYSVNSLFSFLLHCMFHNFPRRFELFILSELTGFSRQKVVLIDMTAADEQLLLHFCSKWIWSFHKYFLKMDVKFEFLDLNYL